MSKRYEFPREFLDLVRTMPWVEAEQLLRDRRTEVLERLHNSQGGAEDIDLGYIMSALNDEIHMVCEKQNRLNWSKAVRAVLGDDAWNQVREYIVANETRTQGING